MAFDPNRLNTAVVQVTLAATKLATSMRAADMKQMKLNVDTSWPQVFKSYAGSTKNHPRLQAWATSYVLTPAAWLQNTSEGIQAYLNLQAAIAGNTPGIATGPIQTPGIVVTPVGPGPVGPVIIDTPAMPMPKKAGMGGWILGGLLLFGGGAYLYKRSRS